MGDTPASAMPASAMLVMAMAHTPTTTATPPTAMARGPLTPSLRPTTAAATATVMADTVATGATATAGGMAVMVMAAGTTGKLKNGRTELSRLAQAIFYESIKNLQKNKFRQI